MRNSQGAARKVVTYRMYSLISLAQATEPRPAVRKPTSAQIITIMANSSVQPSRANARSKKPNCSFKRRIYGLPEIYLVSSARNFGPVSGLRLMTAAQTDSLAFVR